ncbi:hypothetical protein BRADI_3g02122v3 [Brachypodium distachyon]|uniref:Uncharacterized protein n=1 Tax=Brachypodium distachyon TaxID=15368 RepID=A0A0Q3PU75_BRADI|nr:hypothetical protein BRADI_3g02122v3 [Brachypodium distachyon]
MPSYLNFRPLNFRGNHKADTTIPLGPTTALIHIFHVLINPASTDDSMRAVLLQVVVLFCEASRIQMVKDNIEGKMSYDVYQVEFMDLVWACIRKWRKMCDYCLYMRNKLLVQGGDGVQEIEQQEPQPDQPEDEKETELLSYTGFTIWTKSSAHRVS